MKIKLRALRANLLTNKGPYGSIIEFKSGLNVIRAENTSGKSTLINGILYALGLEILVGKRGIEAIKPVLWNGGDYENQEFSVLESSIELELSNSSGEVITVRRQIKGEKDQKIVEVIFGPQITESATNLKTEAYFVGIEGAAQRERGFHYFLSTFFDLTLPKVKRYKGEDSPLYLECIAPLFFIEQIRGWSGIQATLPQSYGIRNVARVAVEYVLNMDVIENEKKRLQISEEANLLREDWSNLCSQMNQIASRLGGRVSNLSSVPVANLTELPSVVIPAEDGSSTSIDDWIIENRASLLEISGKAEQSTQSKGSNDQRLEEQENLLLASQAALSLLRTNLQTEESELQTMKERILFIKDDIQRHKDIKRLRDFGAEAGLTIAQDQCPTCHQNVLDSLIPQDSPVMNLDENIRFLSAELEAASSLAEAGSERIGRLKGSVETKSKEVQNLREIIRGLRKDLLKGSGLSYAAIREQVQLEEKIKELESLREEFEDVVNNLIELAKKWLSNRSKFSELPKEYYSENDRRKLEALSSSFAQDVTEFGYRSSGISHLMISDDNYRPVCDEFEIAFGASASDNIRLIWAYTLALLKVSFDMNGNHWGVLMYDEPEQQKMREASSDALYRTIANIPSEDFQVIVATSASIEITQRRLNGLKHHLLELGDKVIRPLS